MLATMRCWWVFPLLVACGAPAPTPHFAERPRPNHPFRLVVAGDLNVALTDRDVHPKELKPGVVGQRDDERALLRGLIGQGLVDVGRAMDPANEGLFTWWAPWRNLRQRNIGWRIDYLLASEALAGTATQSVVRADVGTSDHAPVVVTFGSPGPAPTG